MKKIILKSIFTLIIPLMPIQLFSSFMPAITTYILLENSSIEIGHDSLMFEDLQRDDTIISAEVYYPSIVNGEQTEIIDEKFPLILFAHGYSSPYINYKYIWENLVKEGYIIVFITTQQGATIDIDEYARDINVLLRELKDEDSLNDSIIKGHITDKTALMGHSTGGGAIYISQGSEALATTVVSLAALGKVYGPIYGSSPIEAAKNVVVPSLILSGDEDCVTPVDVHQEPIYDSLIDNKAIVTIYGGDHCGFSDSTTCEVGEKLSCIPYVQGETIEAQKQKELSMALVLNWFDKYLKNRSGAWDAFESILQTESVAFEILMDEE